MICSIFAGIMSGASYGLDNLCALVDRNRLQISGSTEDVMAGGLFRTFAVIFGPTMLNVIAADSATYIFFYTTLYEAAFYFLPIYLGYACAKKLGASPVLGLLCGGVLIAPSIISAAASGGSGVVSIYGISIAASNYSQTVLPIVLTIPVLYVVEKWMKKHVPDVLSTMFVPFFSMIVIIPIEFIVLAPIGNLIGTGIANALFGLSSLGGIGILIVMAVLGAFWQLFVIAGMQMDDDNYYLIDVQARGAYPAFALRRFEREGIEIPWEEGDAELLAENTVDFVSFSYYSSRMPRPNDQDWGPAATNADKMAAQHALLAAAKDYAAESAKLDGNRN